LSSNNWVIENLAGALDTWNNKFSEIMQIITQSPESFKGGRVWSVIVDINGSL
jgi:hypothetical protein